MNKSIARVSKSEPMIPKVDKKVAKERQQWTKGTNNGSQGVKKMHPKVIGKTWSRKKWEKGDPSYDAMPILGGRFHSNPFKFDAKKLYGFLVARKSSNRLGLLLQKSNYNPWKMMATSRQIHETSIKNQPKYTKVVAKNAPKATLGANRFQVTSKGAISFH